MGISCTKQKIIELNDNSISNLVKQHNTVIMKMQFIDIGILRKNVLIISDDKEEIAMLYNKLPNNIQIIITTSHLQPNIRSTIDYVIIGTVKKNMHIVYRQFGIGSYNQFTCDILKKNYFTILDYKEDRLWYSPIFYDDLVV